jgi:hypothetical protein
MYKDDLQYKTNSELEGLLEKSQKEIEWIKAEINSRNNVSAELLEYKEQLERIIKEATLPYIILKFDRKDTGPVVLVSVRGYTGAEITKSYTNIPGVFITSCKCAVIYYSKNNEHCNISFYENNEYSSPYISNKESFVNTFKRSFCSENDAKKLIADAVSHSCLDYYADTKNDVRKALALDFKSILKIKNEFAEYKL